MKQIRSCFSLSKRKHLLFLCMVLAAVIVSGSVFFLCRTKSEKEQTENQLLSRISSELSGSFRTNLNICWNDFSAAAALEQRYIGDCTLRFLSPPSLEGFEILLSEQNISLSYHGISCQTDSDGLFSSSGAGIDGNVSNLNRAAVDGSRRKGRYLNTDRSFSNFFCRI